MAYAVADDISSQASVERRIRPTFGYYRQPNGWITISPITQLERIRYIEQGWKHLDQYGAFDMSPYVANHPFEGLFMFGGAHEMTVEQLTQTGLYMNPPLVPRCRQHLTQFHRGHNAGCWVGAKPVEFPQMKGVSPDLLGPFPCGFCERQLPTKAGREQHQSVAHKERLGNIQTGQSLGTSLAEALGTVTSSKNHAQLEQRIAELEQLLQNRQGSTTQCECGASFKPGGETFHKRGRQHQQWKMSKP